MKKILLLLATFFCFAVSYAQTNKAKQAVPDSTKPVQIVEASCGKCKFGMKAKGCDLAVRIDGKSYFVDGALIDDFGDAHEDDGMCNAIRKAQVQGTIVNDRFVATYFKVLPVKGKKH